MLLPALVAFFWLTREGPQSAVPALRVGLGVDEEALHVGLGHHGREVDWKKRESTSTSSGLHYVLVSLFIVGKQSMSF